MMNEVIENLPKNSPCRLHVELNRHVERIFTHAFQDRAYYEERKISKRRRSAGSKELEKLFKI